MKKLLIATLLLLTLITSCVPESSITIPSGDLDQRPTMDGAPATLAPGEPTQELKKFNSIEELKTFLRQVDASEGEDYDSPMIMDDIGMPEVSFAESSVSAVPSSVPRPGQGLSRAKKSADDFSTTNVQFEDVDEADYIKNDGRYIYMIADNKLVIVDAYDAKNAEIVSETRVAKWSDEDADYYRPKAKELFLHNDKVVVMLEVQQEAFYFQKYDIEPHQTRTQITRIVVYDVSDRENPKLSSTHEVTGSYYQSRMVDEIMYVVSQQGVRDGIRINEPRVESVERVISPEIFYFDNPERRYQFNTITSLNVEKEEVIDAKTFMLGYSNTLMVNPDNIYIAYEKQRNWWWHRTRYEKERFTEVILPNLPKKLQTPIKEIISSEKDADEQWHLISKELAKFFNSIKDDDELLDTYEDIFDNLADELEEYDTKKELEETKTIIHKIAINKGQLDYVAHGEVYGDLLNQFSLDEHKGNLRLATTVNIWRGGRVQYNNVYVLDENMKKIGEVTGIAEDEKIYSTRFMGDRLYMVTFRQTDPFFVIDLSNPTKPKVLGELKIPGFSDYLHPYDENHIIGVGKETKETEWGFTAEGIKLALFDVSDVANPKLVDKIKIGDRGSNSEALTDHRAFLFSKEKNLLVIPVTRVTKRDRINDYRWSNSIWTGSYVFHLDENGFEEKGRVKHSSRKSDYLSWRHVSTVRRSLYMDDNLYTVSTKYLKINDLANDLEDLNSITLPHDEDRNYWYW